MLTEIDKYINDATYSLMQYNGNILLHGSGGTGKTSIVKNIVRQYGQDLNIILLASTGTAAMNIGGNTIHRIFGFKSKIQLPDNNYFCFNPVLANADLIIIDECSMIPVDVFDAMNRYLQILMRNNYPFGGKKIMLVGDFFQLPPVINKYNVDFYKNYYPNGTYLFNSPSYNYCMFGCTELKKIIRQKNVEFQNLLNPTRIGNVNHSVLDAYNTRVLNLNIDCQLPNDYVVLTPTRNLAEMYNINYMNSIQGAIREYKGYCTGDFLKELFPTSLNLQLKKGAKVMTLRNDPDNRYVNGSIGEVLELKADSVVILVNNKEVEIRRSVWDHTIPVINKKTMKFENLSVGQFQQIPLKLASAMTIHMSQGCTFEKVILDLGQSGSFASGQTYVALSRCTSLEGLILSQPIKDKDIIISKQVYEFLKNTYKVSY